jgi:hypothetical protein
MRKTPSSCSTKTTPDKFGACCMRLGPTCVFFAGNSREFLQTTRTRQHLPRIANVLRTASRLQSRDVFFRAPPLRIGGRDHYAGAGGLPERLGFFPGEDATRKKNAAASRAVTDMSPSAQEPGEGILLPLACSNARGFGPRGVLRSACGADLNWKFFLGVSR